MNYSFTTSKIEFKRNFSLPSGIQEKTQNKHWHTFKSIPEAFILSENDLDLLILPLAFEGNQLRAKHSRFEYNGFVYAVWVNMQPDKFGAVNRYGFTVTATLLYEVKNK